MSLFNLFNKEINCDLCGTKIIKSNAFVFDSSMRGKRPEGEKVCLCKKCFLYKIKQALRVYQGKVVLYYPIKSHNAYHYYKFQEDSIEG